MVDKLKIIELDISKIIQYENNAKLHPETQIEQIANSIKQFGFNDPIAIDDKNVIIEGHGRYLAALKLGMQKIPCIVLSHLTEAKKKAYIIAHNKLTTSTGYDEEKLMAEIEAIKLDDDFDFDLSEIGIDVLDFDREPEQVQAVEDDYEIPDEVKDSVVLPVADIFIYAFSGGKDSTLAFLSTIDRLKAEKKTIEVLMVDTGAEFPSVMAFADRIVKTKGMSLTILRNEKTFQTQYINNNKFPDNLFRDCVETLINSATDKYLAVKYPQQEYVLIRGGRNDQKTKKSKSSGVQKIKGEKFLTIWNPLFDLEKEKYEELLENIPKWEGYGRGYKRTACWCCPFQKKEQWEAMKTCDPLLFNEMKRLAVTMERKEHKCKTGSKKGVDTFWAGFDNYWNNQDFV